MKKGKILLKRRFSNKILVSLILILFIHKKNYVHYSIDGHKSICDFSY